MHRNWIMEVTRLNAELDSRLYFFQELVKQLERLINHVESPIESLSFKVKQWEAECKSPEIGLPKSEKSTISETIGSGAEAATITLTITRNPNSKISGTECVSHLVNILSKYWRQSACVKFGIPDFKTVENYVKETINHLIENEITIAVAYLDIDRFKLINDEISHEKGDEVIRQFSAILAECISAQGGIAINDGGDEFVIIQPQYTSLDILSSLWRIKEKTASINCGHLGALSFTTGIDYISPENSSSSARDTKSRAEAATKDASVDSSKPKKRGTVSFYSANPSQLLALGSEQYSKLGIAIARCHANSLHPFANLIQNFISKVAYDEFVKDSSQDVNAVISVCKNWLNINTQFEPNESDLIGAPNQSNSISETGVGLSITHGWLRACNHNFKCSPQNIYNEINLVFNEGNLVSVQLNDDTILYGTSERDGSTLISAGCAIDCNGHEDSILSAPIIVLSIGFSALPLTPNGQIIPEKLYVDRVVVDDRPKLGGGLPDFWQASIAHVIGAMDQTNGVGVVLVIGNEGNAAQTLMRLRGSLQWSPDDIHIIAGLPRDKVEAIKNDLPSKIVALSDPSELISKIYEASLRLTDCEGSHSEVAPRKSTLNRKLVTDNLALELSGGLQCDTAAAAYPLIVEILRNANDTPSNFDDANQEMRELIGFKLLLNSPASNKIPDYLSCQEIELGEYANNVLINNDGLFGAGLNNANQSEAFTNHLVAILSDPHNVSTRRAILTVSNIIDQVKVELRPLGLVSVWASPRYENEKTVAMDFCFVWRTVEALVGLPYSLYGSIQLAEHLINQVKEKLDQRSAPKKKIQIGKLTYFTFSLHMRMDEYHKRIAKKIVDEASS